MQRERLRELKNTLTFREKHPSTVQMSMCWTWIFNHKFGCVRNVIQLSSKWIKFNFELGSCWAKRSENIGPGATHSPYPETPPLCPPQPPSWGPCPIRLPGMETQSLALGRPLASMLSSGLENLFSPPSLHSSVSLGFLINEGKPSLPII